MKHLRFFFPAILILAALSCHTAQKSAAGGDDGIIEIVFLQLNDIYEIAPLGDNTGGLARVAAIRKELLAKNPNTFTVLSGDFISPSVTGTLKYEDKRIRGRQMVETLNTLGLDWVVFGNHEFDYDQADLQARLDESGFVWMAANARLKDGDKTMQFFKNRPAGPESCPDNMVVDVKDADGTAVKLGLFGVLVNTGKKPWVEYSDHTAAAKTQVAFLQTKSDVTVALTHLDIAEDLKLAAALPSVPLWMGGHDHDNMYHKVGQATVAKADANARTVYVHTLKYNKKTRTSTVKSELRKVNATVAEEPATAAVVAKWEQIKTDALKKSGFDAGRAVYTLKAPLDCRDAFVRYQQAPVGGLITNAMLAVSRNKPVCAILNSGSIRVDDVLGGTLTELDIIRMLPFGGGFSEVLLHGDFLRRVLDAGVNNQGKGGYLQLNGVEKDPATGWEIAGKALSDKSDYWVVLPDFLLTGNETNMDFLKTALAADGVSTNNPGVLQWKKPVPTDKSDLRNDIRLALIDYLRKQ